MNSAFALNEEVGGVGLIAAELLAIEQGFPGGFIVLGDGPEARETLRRPFGDGGVQLLQLPRLPSPHKHPREA